MSASTEAKPPTISVVVLNYNYARFLPACLDSILQQSFTDFELVIIDDTSKDNSLEVIQPYLKDPRVRLMANATNKGFARNLIAGTEEYTTGEFITVVSADDLILRKDAFALQVSLLREHPRAAFCFSGHEILMPDGNNDVFRSYDHPVTLDSAEAVRAYILGGVWALASGTMARRSAYRASGGYRRDIAMVLDLQLWLALCMEGGFTYTPELLFGYRVHASQMSSALKGIRKNAREAGMVLRDVCEAGERRGFGTGNLMRQALDHHLSHPGINEAYQGLRAVAGRRWLAGALEFPVATLTSRNMWILATRVALGEKGTALARGLVGQARRLVGRERRPEQQ